MITMKEVIYKAAMISLNKIFDNDADVQSSNPWIALMNSEAQKMLPGPYILYKISTIDSPQLFEWPEVDWKIIDDSDEAILFELTHR